MTFEKMCKIFGTAIASLNTLTGMIGSDAASYGSFGWVERERGGIAGPKSA